MADVPQSERGVYPKFIVIRSDGRDQGTDDGWEEEGDRVDAQYFVLDFIYDPHAHAAMRAYADSCEDEYPHLAADLRRLADEHEA